MEDKFVSCSNVSMSKQKEKFYEMDNYVDLDSALNELNMLSTITPSRLDYLTEQTAQVKKKLSNSLSYAPLCVVQMNSDFVTKFSLSKNPTSITDYVSNEFLKPDSLCKKMSKLKVTNKYMPYKKKTRRWLEINPKLKAAECELLTSVTEAIPPPIVPRQDSGNKSNPSSPVKSQNSSTSVGCSIFRSRSLDDLEITKLNLKEDCCDIASHGEIDTVSQRISKLQVS